MVNDFYVRVEIHIALRQCIFFPSNGASQYGPATVLVILSAAITKLLFDSGAVQYRPMLLLIAIEVPIFNALYIYDIRL